MYYVKKRIEDGIEFLPCQCEELTHDFESNVDNTRLKILFLLYDYICKRENYFQFNTPTAYGNPEFDRISGIVTGILIGSNFIEEIENGKIVIKSGNRKIIVIEKPEKTRYYHESLREIREAMDF